MRSSRPILLVEDDSIDAMAVKRAIKEMKLANTLVHKKNGEEALAYLRDQANAEPCLVFLDLNMPKMNGLEFLKVIKGDPNLKRIPVVVLTTSNEQRDVVESFKHGVAGYMVKSVDYEKFSQTLRVIDQYWTLSEHPAMEDRSVVACEATVCS